MRYLKASVQQTSTWSIQVQRNSIRTLPQLGYLFLGHLVVLWRVSRCYRVMPKAQKIVRQGPVDASEITKKNIYINIHTHEK